jgi:hypothetical protein
MTSGVSNDRARMSWEIPKPASSDSLVNYYTVKPILGLSCFRFYVCITMSALHSLEYKLFLHHLCKARELSGLTQNEVAQILGKPQSFVSKCEQGERTVDVIDLLRFAKIYNVPLEYFFEGVNIEIG